ncbi:conserved hypothetical protein [Perkinsus marinus ATCC 50983]|uniref:BAP29/BAP31 transmembrane domain-containing protein n=1 Tax=Perkinsus marinus (strain ATCC 50983 / TXsc) TaxID=423536 RepID=C5KC37_PERM5|nr:conserved hypothetical protein [Perkinsus marinus ATCC 50983]EER18068.1 conserved hypothetical protein [Perkinsus marinus ATCC 50983]|eukprot:XP_002786272.1 conserved hypothetical protein [Perkinsus marinus ATCC 50983]
MSAWSFEAYIGIPLAAVVLLLLLSDISFLQKFACKLSNLSFTVGDYGISLSLGMVTIASALFVSQWMTLRGLDAMKETQLSDLTTVELQDRFLMKAWRAERNWWISLFSLTLWLMVWRSATWVQGLIDEEQKDSQQGESGLTGDLKVKEKSKDATSTVVDQKKPAVSKAASPAVSKAASEVEMTSMKK